MSAFRVRRIAAGEGAALRDVRLRALADTPLAFGSTHAREAALPDEHWEEWAAASAGDGAAQALFVAEAAEADAEPPGAGEGSAAEPPGAGERSAAEPPGAAASAPLVGLAFVLVDPGDPTRANLFSMWVAPDARGGGAGTALVAAVVDWVRARGVRILRTAVTVGNDAAARLYARAGFADTGTREPLGHSDAEVRILELTL